MKQIDEHGLNLSGSWQQRPLCRLQYPVQNLSRLQKIYHAAYVKLVFIRSRNRQALGRRAAPKLYDSDVLAHAISMHLTHRSGKYCRVLARILP